MELEDRDKHHEVLSSIKLSRIVLPTLLGLGVVGWMMSRQLELDSLRALSWTSSTLIFIFLAILMYIIRHTAYALRLVYMTNKAFGFWKAMELIVIWEFSSAVSPTSVGGSGVALFFLSQEKLPTGKTMAVILYSMVLDTLFFVLSLPLLYVLLGAVIIRPGMDSIIDLDGYGYTFIAVLSAMFAYGALFFYGLFINPEATKKFLVAIAKIPFLKRFEKSIHKASEDVVLASHEMSRQSFGFHARSFTTTVVAWVTRFLAINFIFLALIAALPTSLYDHSIIYARSETMHVITAFSPTPGGAGIAEYLFGGFYSDYVPKGISTIVALIWRLLTYYPYLVLGALIIPNWIRKLLVKRHKS